MRLIIISTILILLAGCATGTVNKNAPLNIMTYPTDAVPKSCDPLDEITIRRSAKYTAKEVERDIKSKAELRGGNAISIKSRKTDYYGAVKLTAEIFFCPN